jgi:D-alanyl-D-alanine carboxypeptidase
VSGRGVAVVAVVACLLVGCGPAGGTARPGETAAASGVRAAKTTAPIPAARPSVPVPAPAPPSPEFVSSVSDITPELAARMAPSWRDGCPVDLADLRYVTVTHHGFADGEIAQGELVVHADVAAAVVSVFHALFDAGYPIRSMRLVDDFGGDDDASMAADNTSAFNCRAVTGGTGWSEHAYGRAIDLNPVENPYITHREVLPPGGAAFADRPVSPGVIQPGDAVVQAFAAIGWSWGGTWTNPTDYQHFSLSGR